MRPEPFALKLKWLVTGGQSRKILRYTRLAKRRVISSWTDSLLSHQFCQIFIFLVLFPVEALAIGISQSGPGLLLSVTVYCPRTQTADYVINVQSCLLDLGVLRIWISIFLFCSETEHSTLFKNKEIVYLKISSLAGRRVGHFTAALWRLRQLNAYDGAIAFSCATNGGFDRSNKTSLSSWVGLTYEATRGQNILTPVESVTSYARKQAMIVSERSIPSRLNDYNPLFVSQRDSSADIWCKSISICQNCVKSSKAIATQPLFAYT